MPRQQYRSRFTGNHNDQDELRELLDEQCAEIRADIGMLDERQTHLEMFVDDAERKTQDLVERVDKLEVSKTLPVKPVQIQKVLPPPLDTGWRGLVQQLARLVRKTIDTPHFGAAAFSLLVSLGQVSTFYMVTAVILLVCACLIGWRRAFPPLPF